MNIKFVTHTEIVKGNEGRTIILKSTLPAVSECDGKERINAFYIKLKEAHKSAVKKALRNLSSGLHRLTLNCRLTESEGAISFLREYTYQNTKREEKGAAIVDTFSLDGRFIKKRKKKKQGK